MIHTHTNLSEAVQSVMDSAVLNHEAAGVNLLVLHRGKTILRAESGCADLEHSVPMKPDSIFRLYSMSKPVTAAAVMILMERGLIDLCDPVSLYLPGFRSQKAVSGTGTVPVKRAMTVRDLLSMTSGLPYGGTDPAGQAAEAVIEELKSRMNGPDPMTTVEFANRLGEQPLAFHPGEHFMYGTSADILGAIVEVVSGMSFGDFLKKEIFDPLGMNDTGFYVPADRQNRLAKTYERLEDGSLREFPTNHLGISFDLKSEPAYQAGGAGLVSTLPDYAKFASMLLGGGTLGDVRILLPATVRYMTGGTLLPWQQEDLWRSWDGLTGYSYGCLMRVMKEPGMAVMQSTLGEYGWDGWLGPYFSNHPAEQLTFLMGIQKKDAGTCALTRKLRNVVLSRYTECD